MTHVIEVLVHLIWDCLHLSKTEETNPEAQRFIFTPNIVSFRVLLLLLPFLLQRGFHCSLNSLCWVPPHSQNSQPFRGLIHIIITQVFRVNKKQRLRKR